MSSSTGHQGTAPSVSVSSGVSVFWVNLAAVVLAIALGGVLMCDAHEKVMNWDVPDSVRKLAHGVSIAACLGVAGGTAKTLARWAEGRLGDRAAEPEG